MKNQIQLWEKEAGVKFLKGIGIKSGQRVLDFGCRLGHYTIPAARIVGPGGIIYAVDRDRQALEQLEQKAKKLRLVNIKIAKTSGQLKLDLERESIDVVLLYDVLHYMERHKRKLLYREIFDIQKPDALLSVYPKHVMEDEPAMEFQRMTLNEVKQEIEDAYFVFVGKSCGLISHDDGLNSGCVLNFRKRG